MKWMFLILAICLGVNAYSADYSGAGVPEIVRIVSNVGFRVSSGDFGNPEDCGIPNQIVVPQDHPQYSEIYSTVLAAYMAKKKIRFYVNSCQVHSWISSNSMNTLSATQTNQVEIRD